MLDLLDAAPQERPLPAVAVLLLLAIGGVIGAWLCQRRLRAAKNAAEYPATTAKWLIVAGVVVFCAVVYLVSGGAR